MAGYFIYSIDWNPVETFLSRPTKSQLKALTAIVSDHLDFADKDLTDTDPMALWPSQPNELIDVIKSHLVNFDWYTSFSDIGKYVWESSIQEFFRLQTTDVNFGFKCECDGVYWNLIDEARLHYSIPVNAITDIELSHFGTRPLRYLQSGESGETIHHLAGATHSMHTPDEVVKMAEQFAAAEATIDESRFAEVLNDYEALMSVFDRIIPLKRILYVVVDT